jgi:ketosteroid isomerase-like protein
MKTKPSLIALLVLFSITSGAQTLISSSNVELNRTLFKKDSLLFNAIFRTCNLKAIESLLTEDFVFYQDKGFNAPTTTQPKKEFIADIKKNFCEGNSKDLKMRREIVKESLQVYSINSMAMQTGIQHFYISTEANSEQLVEESKFSRQWQKKNGEWKLASELDYAINTKSNSAPVSQDLYNEISQMDSVLFTAFNNHDMEKFKSLFTTDLEFYHDKGGLTDYTYTINSFKNTIAQNNGLRRDLLKGSLEVYPIKDYGAIQIGVHTFCHDENGKKDCGSFKFVHVWKKINGEWKISRVVSYDH